jgi:hypothetical protein
MHDNQRGNHMLDDTEKRPRITPDSPYPKGRFWIGETWGFVIRYHAKYMARTPFGDCTIYNEGERLFLLYEGRPTLRQVIPKALEGYTIAACASFGVAPEPGRWHSNRRRHL